MSQQPPIELAHSSQVSEPAGSERFPLHCLSSLLNKHTPSSGSHSFTLHWARALTSLCRSIPTPSALQIQQAKGKRYEWMGCNSKHSERLPRAFSLPCPAPPPALHHVSLPVAAQEQICGTRSPCLGSQGSPGPHGPSSPTPVPPFSAGRCLRLRSRKQSQPMDDPDGPCPRSASSSRHGSIPSVPSQGTQSSLEEQISAQEQRPRSQDGRAPRKAAPFPTGR